jgi:ribosomal protein S12
MVQAIRKCVRVQLIKNGKKVTAFGTTPRLRDEDKAVEVTNDGYEVQALILYSTQRWLPELRR